MYKRDLANKSSGKMARAFFAGIAAMLSASVALAATQPQTKDKNAPKKIEARPGQYVVELQSTRATYNQSLLEQRLGGKIIDQIRPNMILIQRAKNENMRSVTKSLRSLPEVTIAEPNFIFHALGVPNDPDYSKLWNMNNTGALDTEGTKGIPGLDVGVERAWDVTKGSRDVVVAIIDTGVDYNHPELKNNIWTNLAEANGQAGVDDDNNGYIDDIHGYNFSGNNADPLDDNGHGTHCAGVIGAEGNNGIGIVGVNWNVSIMAVKFLDAGGSGDLDAAVKALDYASKSGAKILSNSWGGNVVSEILEKAVGDTMTAGKLFVAAAGNDGNNNDTTSGAVPASYKFDNIVSVAALDNRGELAYFSNFGEKSVHVAAPGVNIYSSINGNAYETMSGTSMAAPHVSGVAALLLSAQPTMTYKEIKDRLISSSRPIAGLHGRTVTGGIVDAYYAVTGLTPPADPNDPSIWTERVQNPISTEHPYAVSSTKTFTVHVDGAKHMSVHFAKFETEQSYDKVEFADAAGSKAGTWSGNQSGRFSPIVDGDTMVITLTSDSSVTGYGFDIDFVSVER